MSSREIVASLCDNRYSYGSVYVFGYTTSWMSRLALSGLAIKIRGYFRPPRWVIVNKIATLRDDRHIRTSAYVFGYTTSWITRSACFVFAFQKLCTGIIPGCSSTVPYFLFKQLVILPTNEDNPLEIPLFEAAFASFDVEFRVVIHNFFLRGSESMYCTVPFFKE